MNHNVVCTATSIEYISLCVYGFSSCRRVAAWGIAIAAVVGYGYFSRSSAGRDGKVASAVAFSDKEAQAWNAGVKASNPFVKPLPEDHDIPGLERPKRKRKSRKKKAETQEESDERQ